MSDATMDLEDLAGPGWAQPDAIPNLDEPGPLFDGDTGTLPVEVRRTMVSLLKKRYISADQNPADWHVLMDYEDLLRARFNDLFINLVVDRDYSVAYKRQAQPDGGSQPFPTMLHNQAYSREETILLVRLRMLLRGSHPDDDAVFVDRSDLMDEIATFRPPDTTNHVRDERAAEKAIDNLQTLGLLLETGDPTRFRIAPIVEVLMSVARLGELIEWLIAARGVTPADSESAADMALDAGDEGDAQGWQ